MSAGLSLSWIHIYFSKMDSLANYILHALRVSMDLWLEDAGTTVLHALDVEHAIAQRIACIGLLFIYERAYSKMINKTSTFVKRTMAYFILCVFLRWITDCTLVGVGYRWTRVLCPHVSDRLLFSWEKCPTYSYGPSSLLTNYFRLWFLIWKSHNSDTVKIFCHLENGQIIGTYKKLVLVFNWK